MRRIAFDSGNCSFSWSSLAALLFHGLVTSVATAQIPVPANGIINQPGQYYLQQDLIVTRDTGIKIDANNVTLDLAGHALRFADMPRVGTFGIVATGRTNVRITNGTIGAFWFNVHASQNHGLRIDNMTFDDIPYIGVNAAVSHDVVIRDSAFTNFRYDIPKAVDPYVIGINIGAEDAVIAGNSFGAVYTGSDPHVMAVETVLVLFSADVSQRSVVTRNEMTANVPLNRSYGLWVASGAHVTAMHNTIQNMRYGITLASNATALAGYNDISVDPPPPGVPPLASTFGVFASAAEQIIETGNHFHGQTHPTFLPPDVSDDWDNANMVLRLEINDLSATLLPGIGYDRIEFTGTFMHGGSVIVDVSAFNGGPVSELKLVGWASQVGNQSSTAVSCIGGPAMAYEFRSDGLYVDVGGTLVGDYNGDSAVDAADYVMWRKAYGTQDLYDAWRAHFGETYGGGSSACITSAARASVPEPAVGALYTNLAVVAILALRRRAPTRVRLNCHHHEDRVKC